MSAPVTVILAMPTQLAQIQLVHSAARATLATTAMVLTVPVGRHFTFEV